jgi:hypothetical protein
MATFRWNSATSGNWSTNGDWARKGSPGLGDVALVNPTNPGDSPFTVTDDISAEIGALTLAQAAATLQIGAVPGQSIALTIDGTSDSRNIGFIAILKGSTLTLGGTLNNAGGLIELNSDAGFGAGLTLAGATVEKGKIDVEPSAQIAVAGSSLLDAVNVTLGGSIDALDGATLELGNATIRGGTLAAAGTGRYETVSGTGGNWFDGRAAALTLASGATVTVSSGSTLTLEGTIHDGGEIDVAANVPNVSADLVIMNRVTLDGGGTVSLLQSDLAYAALDGPGFLTNYDTIDGGGQISVSMANYGTIASDGRDGDIGLTIAFGSMTNRGTIEATGAGQGLLIFGETVTNQHGTIEGLNGGTVGIDQSRIIGGTIAGNIDALLGPPSLLDGVTVAPGANILVEDASQLALQDTIINRGTIEVQSLGANETDLLVNPDTALTGGGQIVLDDSGANGIQTNNGAVATLTNVNNTISGAGSIGDGDQSLHLVNEKGGTILASGTHDLVINTGNTVANDGVIEATAGSTLVVDDQVTNSSGLAKNVWAHGGMIDFNSLLPNTVGGVTLDAGGSVEFKHAASADVTIHGSHDTLLLDDSHDFQGTIGGAFGNRGGTNTIDLADISYAGLTGGGSATYQQASPANGTLTLNDGAHSTSLALLGQFIGSFNFGAAAHGASGFVLADDGTASHGTAVSYITPPAAV